MSEPPRPEPKPTHAVGERGTWGPSPALLAIALGLVAAGLTYWWVSKASTVVGADDSRASASAAASSANSDSWPFATKPTPAAPAQMPANMAASIAATTIHPVAGTLSQTASAPRISRLRDPAGDQTPDLADYVNEGEQPTMAEVIDRLHQAGVHTGLGAFSPPGTRPPLVGLAVPESYALPEGYVRHYQATDDGQRIEPILMFAPGYQFFDTAGQPIAIPKDRVVPPELAPQGLSVRRIVVPAPTSPAKPGS